MRHVQTNHIQQREQRQGGLLGTLFNVLSMIPIPEAQMAGRAGNAFLNPTGSNLGSVVSQTAKMVGGGDGQLSDPSSSSPSEDTSPNEPDDEPELVHNSEEEKLEVEAVPVGGKTPEAVTDDPEKKDDKNNLDLYSGMTMDEVFKMHPELQNMFAQHLFST